MQGLSRLSAWWVALGIDLERGRPGHPQDNGAHERLHRDISLELQLDYPQMIARRVNKNGKINWANHQLSLSVRVCRGGRSGSNPLSKSNLKFGLPGCCWAGSIPKPPASDVPTSCQKPGFERRIPTYACPNPKDKRWALESVGFNLRLIHNRLFPGRFAAAT